MCMKSKQGKYSESHNLTHQTADNEGKKLLK